MKKMIAFIFIILFAMVFILSYMFGIPESRRGKAINLIGQIGLGASLLVFFILPGKKIPLTDNKRQTGESD